MSSTTFIVGFSFKLENGEYFSSETVCMDLVQALRTKHLLLSMCSGFDVEISRCTMEKVKEYENGPISRACNTYSNGFFNLSDKEILCEEEEDCQEENCAALDEQEELGESSPNVEDIQSNDLS